MLFVDWYFTDNTLFLSVTYIFFTVFQDKDIVAEDKQTEVVRIINTYDTEGNAFINTALLTDLMAALNLLTEPEE